MKRILSFVAVAFLLAGVCLAQFFPPSLPSPLSGVAGNLYAPSFAYGFYGNPAGKVSVGNAATGSSTITVESGYIVLADGRVVLPFSVGAPILIDIGTVQETVTPTTVSGCGLAPAPSGIATCSITGSFTNLHPHGAIVASGTFGLQEAINDAQNAGGGKVVVDKFWATAPMLGTATILAAATPYSNVYIEDDTSAVTQYWSPAPSASTFLAVPATLTALTALPSATPVGAYGTGTYFLCVSYVDVMGNEGACSLTFSEAGLATGSFIFTAPAASAGAVGYTICISLTAGSYAFAYQVPLTSTVCTLTKLETITPACAVTNATYGQTGATATVTAITVNTSPLALQLGVASTTADYVGNSNGRTTYSYTAGSHLALSGIQGSSLAFTAGPATVATTVPQVIGTLAVPAGFMNLVDKTIRVCGKEQMTGASATIEQVQLWWDGAGSDAAGVPVNIANLQAAAGPNTAAAYNGNFCWTGHTTVSGAGVTAGSIQGDFSIFDYYLASAPVGSIFTGGDTFTAATASLNLAGGAGFTSRLHIVQLHTAGTDVSPKLVSATVEVLD